MRNTVLLFIFLSSCISENLTECKNIFEDVVYTENIINNTNKITEKIRPPISTAVSKKTILRRKQIETFVESKPLSTTNRKILLVEPNLADKIDVHTITKIIIKSE